MRVLVVEDQADMAASLQTFLGSCGHDVEVAYDGPAAVQMAAERQVDVVFLDIGLPGGMDGHEVARRIREQPGERNPLLVAVTGHGREEDRRQSERAGIHLHLLKPVEPATLQRLLRRFETVLN